MSNVKIMKTVTTENRPTFNDWCQEFNVSSSYVEPNLKNDYKLTKPLNSKEDSFWEMLGKTLGL
jgi:hypothetical protein